MEGEATIDVAADAGVRRRSSSDRTLRAVLALVESGPVLILVLLALVMSVLSPVFLTVGNITNLGVQTSIVAAVAIGQLLVVLTRGVDLSVGSVVGLSGVVGALVAASSVGTGLTTLVAIPLVGAAVGLVNGFILVKLRVPHPLIVTLATLGIVRGLALQLSDGETLVDIPAPVITAGSGEVAGFPVPVLIVIGLAALFAFLTRRTRWGRWIYAIGGNPEAAERAGLPVSRVLLSVYVVCGLTAGIAGLITAGRTAAGSPNAGILLELDALTAVIIGGASFFGGRGSIWNVVVGALIIGLIRNGLNLLNVTPFYQQMAVGSLILVAIQLDVIRARLETRLQVVRSLRHAT
jgi:ribose transport system permease protein